MSRLTLDLPKSSDPIDNKAAVIWLQNLAGDRVSLSSSPWSLTRNFQGPKEYLGPSLSLSCLGNISYLKLSGDSAFAVKLSLPSSTVILLSLACLRRVLWGIIKAGKEQTCFSRGE